MLFFWFCSWRRIWIYMFYMFHLRWHVASVYRGHLWGPMTLTPVAERLAVELSLPVFTQLGFEHPTFHLRGERSNWLRHRRGLYFDAPCHSRCGTLKNPHWSMVMSAEYRSTFKALHRLWWRHHMSKIFSSGT